MSVVRMVGKPRRAPAPRHWVMGGALAATLAATLWAAQQDDAGDVALPAAGSRRAVNPARSAIQPSAQASSPAQNWDLKSREAWQAPTDDELTAWAPPPPPPPPPPPAPPAAAAPPVAAPVAPPFPYELIGSLSERGASQALIAGPNRTMAAKVGDVIDGQWKVERVDSSGMALLWQPAQLRQIVSFKPVQ